MSFEQLLFSCPPERFAGIRRRYTPEDVLRLRGSLAIRQTLAEQSAERLWKILHAEGGVRALGIASGMQAMQTVKAGARAIYLSGWQLAVDGNLAATMYPDLSLYPSNSGPEAARRINRTLQRADQIEHASGRRSVENWFVPIVADGEAGWGSELGAFELTKAYIEAGAAGVHFEDQLASERVPGPEGGKVLVPVETHIRKLCAARFAADIMGVPTIIIARTDARTAKFISSDMDARDRPFIAGSRTPEGYLPIKGGLDLCVTRALAYAPYADILWFETSVFDMKFAQEFSAAVRRQFPHKLLAYNLSTAFDWTAQDPGAVAKVHEELSELGYRFQFITVAGFHSSTLATFDLARKFDVSGMTAYAELQSAQRASEDGGYTANRHQREVGTEYFEAVAKTIGGHHE